jgi:hypothetical protein
MHEMLKTYFGNNDKGRTQTFEWISRFKRRETLAEDCEHSGHPFTGRTEKDVKKVHKIVSKDQQITISDTSDILGLLYEECQ